METNLFHCRHCGNISGTENDFLLEDPKSQSCFTCLWSSQVLFQDFSNNMELCFIFHIADLDDNGLSTFEYNCNKWVNGEIYDPDDCDDVEDLASKVMNDPDEFLKETLSKFNEKKAKEWRSPQL